MIDEDFLWQRLKTVFDPEVSVNIVDLGLVYRINVHGPDDACFVEVDVTLTSPTCPLGNVIVENIKDALLSVNWCKEVKVNIVFDPPWNKNMITEVGMMELGLI